MTVAGKYVKRDPNSFVRNRRSSIARGVGYMAQRSNDDLKASIWVRPAVVFALIVQQGAFINKPPEMFGTSSMELADVNMLNTIGVAISVAMIVIPACFNARKIGYLASKNALTLLYMALVLISVVWSINPDLTIRRGLGYVLSMAIAAFLTVRFDETERMKLLSASLAVSAIGSLLYVAAMNEGIDLTGSWSGVFPGKNVLGLMMALGLFVELFVLVASRGRPRWRFILLSLYFALVLLSRSATAVLISAMYLTAAFIYLLWKRDQTVAVVTALIVVLASLLGTFVLWVEPEFALGLLGKDTGLTGRTALWDVVVGLIQNRPWLGYGYRVM